MATPKRKSVTINESFIQDMMSGEISGHGRDSADEKPVAKPEAEDLAPESSMPEPKPRKRKEPKDYSGLFLQKRPSEQKRHTYINARIWDTLTGILPVIAPGVTIPTFIDNILSHHLESYRDEINELYMNKIKPL